MSRDKKSRFEWLQDYMKLDDEIRYLEWKIRKAKAEEDRWENGDLSRVHLEAGSKGAHVLDHIDEYQKALMECKAEQYDLLKLIDTFTGYENQILKLKYVDGMTLEEIAERLGYSYETVRAKHAELHRRLDFIDTWEDERRRFEDRYDSGIAGI